MKSGRKPQKGPIKQGILTLSFIIFTIDFPVAWKTSTLLKRKERIHEKMSLLELQNLRLSHESRWSPTRQELNVKFV